MEKRSSEFLEYAKTGKLHYYFDPGRCSATGNIKLENGIETKVK